MSRPRTGTVANKPNGRFEARWHDEHSKRRSKTFTRKRDAQVFLRKELSRVDDVLAGHAVGVPLGHTLAELGQVWVTGPGAHKKSIKDDQSMLRAHLIPAMGSKLITKIGPTDIARFKAERRGVVSDNTVNHHLTLLISMLRHAVEIEWLAKVPKVQKYKLAEQPYSYLSTHDEIGRFLDAARDDGPTTYDIYRTAIYTGLRLGELAGLRTSAVDIERRMITVRKSYEGTPKSGRIRYVPIFAPILETLKARVEGLPPGALLFCTSTGTMLHKDSRVFKERLAGVLADAGFPKGYITFHDLRHTFASSWVMSGGDLFKLQKLLGHASIEMTQRYAHLAPHAFADDLDRLPDLG